MNFSNILKIKNADYRYIISGIRKTKAKNYCKILIQLKKMECYIKNKYQSNFETVNLIQILI